MVSLKKVALATESTPPQFPSTAVFKADQLRKTAVTPAQNSNQPAGCCEDEAAATVAVVDDEEDGFIMILSGLGLYSFELPVCFCCSRKGGFVSWSSFALMVAIWSTTTTSELFILVQPHGTWTVPYRNVTDCLICKLTDTP